MGTRKFLLRLLSAAALTGFLISSAPVYAANPSEAFPDISSSKAYQQFKTRPHSDFSKLLFLIERFENSGIEIVYDGHYYKAFFAAKLARWFLARNYRKETPQEWIMRWCNTSIPSGKLVYVKFADGKFKLSREVLMGELKALEETVAAEGAAPLSEKKTENAILAIPVVTAKVIASEAAPSPAVSAKLEPPQR